MAKRSALATVELDDRDISEIIAALRVRQGGAKLALFVAPDDDMKNSWEAKVNRIDALVSAFRNARSATRRGQ